MPAEREAKLSVPAGFVLPDLRGVAGEQVFDRGTHVLDAVYWDSATLALYRSQHGLRFRTRDGTAGTWTLKGPSVTLGPAVEREETEVPGHRELIPAQLLAMIQPLLGGAELVPVAQIRTERAMLDVQDQSRTIAEVVDDQVSVLTPEGREVARFREVEVEVSGATGRASLDAIVRRLESAGAAVDLSSKYSRALIALGRLDRSQAGD